MNGRRVCQLLLVLATLGASGAAMAGGGWGGGGYHGGGGGYYHGGGYCCGGSVGLYFGPGFGYGYPYPYYAYSYPSYYPGYYPGYYPYGAMAGDVSPSPTQYVEQRQDAQADMGGGAAPQVDSWYYCRNPEGYYPYVKACSGGWQKVPARPPGS